MGLVEREKIKMNEYEPTGQPEPEKNFWCRENQILLGATGVAVLVGPLVHAVGGIAVGVSGAVLAYKGAKEGFRRIGHSKK